MRLVSNRIIEIKIAYKTILKRPIRNIFTKISIILGVGIFFSVNIATDPLDYSLQQHIDPSLYGNINHWIYLFRGILMVFSAISLIICVLIIKNLMEISKEDQIYELGLLRAIGNSKFSIFSIFFNQIPVLTCRENIELPLISVGMKKNERKERVLDLIHKVGLEKHLNHRPSQLSGGQQQRVAIARALVNRPSIFLTDEPTRDLDTTTGDKVINYLKSINELEEQSIIIVTHDFNIADRTDKIYQILDGVFIN